MFIANQLFHWFLENFSDSIFDFCLLLMSIFGSQQLLLTKPATKSSPKPEKQPKTQ
jgi:hypothetical protein